MTYADLESILVSEDNEIQHPEEFYMSKHQKHIACNYSCKFVYIDNKIKI